MSDRIDISIGPDIHITAGYVIRVVDPAVEGFVATNHKGQPIMVSTTDGTQLTRRKIQRLTSMRTTNAIAARSHRERG